MIDIYNLPQELEVYQNIFWNGRTTGVFQFSSNNAKHLCRQIKPKSIQDLAVINALNRPAILDAGVDQDYIACRQGLQQPKKIHPIVDKIGMPTYNIWVYQEQCMQICVDFGGMAFIEADALRKAMKHKSGEEFEVYKTKFITNATKKSNQETAQYVWDLIEKFSAYGFSIVHSTSYSYLGYVCAFLKYHYASEFYTANLTEECGQQDRERFVELIREAQAGGIEILPPDVNRSTIDFNLESTKHGNYHVYPIRFGLCGIKGLGEKGLNKLLTAKPKDGFTNLNDLIKICDVRTFACLLRSGALDELEFKNSTGSSRREKLALYKELKKSKAKAEVHNQPSLADEQESLGLILNPKLLFDKYIDKFEALKDEITDPSQKKLKKFDFIGIAGIIIEKRYQAAYRTLFILTPSGFTFKIYIGDKHIHLFNLSVGDGIAGIVMYLQEDQITINDSKGRCYLKRIEDVK